MKRCPEITIKPFVYFKIHLGHSYLSQELNFPYNLNSILCTNACFWCRNFILPFLCTKYTKCVQVGSSVDALAPCVARSSPAMVLHRENSPVTQTSPEPTLLSWGGGPLGKIPPHPWPHCKPGLIQLIGPLRPYCPQSPLILLRCVTEIKFAQNLRWLGTDISIGISSILHIELKVEWNF